MCILSQLRKNWKKKTGECKTLIWKSFMGRGIPDLERTTGGKVLWRTIDYLPSWLKDTSLIFQTSKEGYKRQREYNGPLWNQQAY